MKNFPHFFVNRPIFAVVISVLIVILGALSLFKLPLSEYPAITPPTVQVMASYPGANPKIIAETVSSPLEQAVNGVENMLYMSSQTAADGNTVEMDTERQKFSENSLMYQFSLDRVSGHFKHFMELLQNLK